MDQGGDPRMWKIDGGEAGSSHVDKKKILNFNIVILKKVDKPRGVEQCGLEFFGEFRLFFMLFGHFNK